MTTHLRTVRLQSSTLVLQVVGCAIEVTTKPTVIESTMNSTVSSGTVFCMSTNDIESDHQSNNHNPDASNVNRYLLNHKSNCNIGTWNVQTMYSTSKTAQVIKEIGQYKLDI